MDNQVSNHWLHLLLSNTNTTDFYRSSSVTQHQHRLWFAIRFWRGRNSIGANLDHGGCGLYHLPKLQNHSWPIRSHHLLPRWRSLHVHSNYWGHHRYQSSDVDNQQFCQFFHLYHPSWPISGKHRCLTEQRYVQCIDKEMSRIMSIMPAFNIHTNIWQARNLMLWAMKLMTSMQCLKQKNAYLIELTTITQCKQWRDE